MSYEQIQERCFLEHEESKREVQLADETVFEETKLESTNSQRLVSAGMGFQRQTARRKLEVEVKIVAHSGASNFVYRSKRYRDALF
jgi:hypothetical protein